MNPIRSLLLAAAGLVLAGAAFAQQKVIPAQSEISFVSKQMGVPVEGKFRKWTADIAFDPKKPEAGKVSFAIDTGSATVGSAESDAELPKPAWFGVVKFPQATFSSTSVKASGANRFEVAGKLTIKGSVRDVTVVLTLAQAGGVTTASGQFPIKRLEFKIGEGEWSDTSMVADEVQVKFRIALSGVASL